MTATSFPTGLADAMRGWRVDRQWNRKQAARSIGTTPLFIEQLERGQILPAEIGPALAMRILNATGLDMATLGFAVPEEYAVAAGASAPPVAGGAGGGLSCAAGALAVTSKAGDAPRAAPHVGLVRAGEGYRVTIETEGPVAMTPAATIALMRELTAHLELALS